MPHPALDALGTHALFDPQRRGGMAKIVKRIERLAPRVHDLGGLENRRRDIQAHIAMAHHALGERGEHQVIVARGTWGISLIGA